MTLFASEEDGRSSRWRVMLTTRRLLRKDGIVKKSGASYFALFRPLRDLQSRFILVCGIVLAIARISRRLRIQMVKQGFRP